jgi:hypothetical protein
MLKLRIYNHKNTKMMNDEVLRSGMEYHLIATDFENEEHHEGDYLNFLKLT